MQIAISSCLLGQTVRYDGGHKAHPFIVDILLRYLQSVPICPEVAVGMGVPRPPIQLTRKNGQIRAMGREDAGMDVTQSLVNYGRSVAPSLDRVSGYIFKSRSPSCGLWDACVQENDSDNHEGRGVFANEIARHWPQLPVLDEHGLGDPGLRDNYFERVYAYSRWQKYVGSGLTLAKIEKFQTQHELSLVARDLGYLEILKEMVKLNAQHPIDQWDHRYIQKFMTLMTTPATRQGHGRALTQAVQRLDGRVNSEDKNELHGLIERYHSGHLSRMAPIAVIRHHLRYFPDDYLGRQVYLRPHPDEWILRR